MKNGLKQFIIKIRDNLDLYLVILLSALIAILAAFDKVDIEIVGAAILATLTVLAVSMLVNRRTVLSLKDSTRTTNNQIKELKYGLEKEGIGYWLSASDYPDLLSDFSKAKRISILGINLTSTINRYDAEFKALIARGGYIRFMISEQSEHNVNMLAFRSSLFPNPEAMGSAIQLSIARALLLNDFCNNIDQLEIRSIRYPQPCGLVIIEKENGVTQIHGKIMTFRRIEEVSLVSFRSNSQTDEYWCNYFINQFESLWNIAEQKINQG